MPNVQYKGGSDRFWGRDANRNRVAAGQDPRIFGAQGPKFLDLDVDQQSRYESFILADDEKKVEVDPETRKYRAHHS